MRASCSGVASVWKRAFHSAAGRRGSLRARGGLVSPAPASLIQSARQLRQAGKPIKVDVLRIVAMAQVAHQAAERGGGHRIGQGIERRRGIAGTGCRIRIHGNHSLGFSVA
jgi:hypothetical protein